MATVAPRQRGRECFILIARALPGHPGPIRDGAGLAGAGSRPQERAGHATAPNEKRVTALAFPGAATKPTYVNLTGARVVLRSAAAVGEVCGPAQSGSVTESVIPPGERAEVKDACWCCAPSGDTRTPGNKSGIGQAFLERCF